MARDSAGGGSKWMCRVSMLCGLAGTTGGAWAGVPVRLWIAEYQFNAPSFVSIELDGSGPSAEFAPPASEWLPVGIEIQPAFNRVFWIDAASPNNLFVSGLNGAGRLQIATPGSQARGPAIDALGRAYFKSDQTIRRVNADGTGLITLYTTTGTGGAGSGVSGAPCVDSTNGHVYFGASGTILRMDLDGSNVVTVLSKVSRVTDIKLDVANGKIYFLDGTNNSDYVGRANLDGTGFEVLFDNGTTPQGTSGLAEMELADGFVFFADELQDTVRRMPADGSGSPQVIYTAPSGKTPFGLALSSGPLPQTVLDLNGNGISDVAEIAGGAPDCNANGVPDDAESNLIGGAVCDPLPLLQDNGADVNLLRLAIGGGTASAWEQYQPFEVPAGGWSVGHIGVAAQTIERDAQGALLGIFPEDGAGNPDRANPVASASVQFRYSYGGDPFEYFALDADLMPGRYFVGLLAQNNATYFGEVLSGTSGEARVFNGASGVWRVGTAPLAVRIVEREGAGCDADWNGSGGQPDSGDFLAYLNDWSAQAPRADLAPAGGDGVWDSSDFLAYLNLFVAGC